jgi:dihydroorotase-like cyclic amidohydrolase
MYDLIIRDATIVSSTGREVADVAIRNGRIAYVGPSPSRGGKEEVSAIGMFLMPGVIDTAVQFDTDGDSDIWERESRAAVTGGITTVLSLPGGKRPVVDSKAAKARAKVANGSSWCNYGLWGAAHNGNAAELSKALDAGLLIGTLAFLADDDDDTSIHPDRLGSYLTENGVLGVQVGEEINAEQGTTIDDVLTTARKTGSKIHVVHLSTAAELQRLDPVRGDIPVTASVTPHHLFLSVDEDEGVCTMPPVRPEQDRRTLWTAVKRGRLDCVASDHHPHRGSLNTPGVPGAELLFPLMLSAVKYGRLSLELLVSLCSERPADIFGLAGKGRIAKGADADLILFSEGEITTVTEDQLVSGAGWSPYTTREAAPKPELVIVNGEIVASRGQIIAKNPNGQRVARPVAVA